MIGTVTTDPHTLLSASAVRERAHRILDAGLAGRLTHVAIDLDLLDVAAHRVLGVIDELWPELDVPLHTRWRQFSAGSIDRWGQLGLSRRDPAERARTAFDLAIVSVLLDAGAGSAWAFREAETARHFERSEGLAVASFRMIEAGVLSADPDRPFRVDAARLSGLSEEILAERFQVTQANPLVGVEGRTALLRRLGDTIAAAPEVFGSADTPRPGGLFDHLVRSSAGKRIAAADILRAVLDQLGPIWPDRIAIGGIPLGDTWRHPFADPDGLMPLHMLSQRLAYSLVEPLADAGYAITGLEMLAGLAEYRNGGLMLDTGVLRLKDPAAAQTVYTVDSELVVEWRALTVALLDRLAERVRALLDLDAETLPLAAILEATRLAGRAVAREIRADAGPPIAVVSDGTVF